MDRLSLAVGLFIAVDKSICPLVACSYNGGSGHGESRESLVVKCMTHPHTIE